MHAELALWRQQRTLHSGGTHWKMKFAEATPSSASISASEPHSPASSVGLEPMPPAGAGAGGAGWPGWACGRTGQGRVPTEHGPRSRA